MPALRLAGLADGFLMHNRPIYMRVDDSVVREYRAKPYLIRRSRGYAPDPSSWLKPVRPILATGAELKNVFCLTRQNYAFVSHHIGDMENFETLRSFEEGILHYERLFRIQPEVIRLRLTPELPGFQICQGTHVSPGTPAGRGATPPCHLAACPG